MGRLIRIELRTRPIVLGDRAAAAIAGGLIAQIADDVIAADAAAAAAASAASINVSAPIEAIEDILLGHVVNVHSAAGAKMQKADASDATKPANGFVRADVDNGDEGDVYFSGQKISGLAGLTPGITYFLSTVGGELTDVRPAADGNLVQEVGLAVSATELIFIPKWIMEL